MKHTKRNTFSVPEIHKMTAYFRRERQYEKDIQRIQSTVKEEQYNLMEQAKSKHLNNQQYELQNKLKRKERQKSIIFDNNNNNDNNNNKTFWHFGIQTSQPIVPVTCKQAYTAIEQSLENDVIGPKRCIIDGKPVSNIILIGKINKKCNKYNNQQWWSISDDTLPRKEIDILFNTNDNTEQWNNAKDNEQTGKVSICNKNLKQKDIRLWYKIFATIHYESEPQEQFILQGVHQTIIHDKHEIMFHFLECIHAHLTSSIEQENNL